MKQKNKNITINKAFIDSLMPPKKDSKVYWDSKLTGLGIRITSNNVKSFVLRYIIEGSEKRYTIGRYPDLSYVSAKEIAVDLKSKIARGFDPLTEKQKTKETLSIEELSIDFMNSSKNKIKENTFIFYQKTLKKHILPKFSSVKIDKITSDDIEKFHNSLRDKKHTANRVLDLMSSIFNYAIRRNFLTNNPARKIKKYQEEKRQRYLTQQEIDLLKIELDKSENKINSYAVLLLLLTGSRKNELLKAKWIDFDFENETWMKSELTTKQRKISYIPLNRKAIEILKDMQKNIINDRDAKQEIISNEEYLFFNTKTQKPLGDIKRFWQNLKDKAKIQDIRIHDLRHTFASILINNGVDLNQTGVLLGHSNSNTTKRYAHLLNKTLKNSSNVICDVV